MRIGHGYDVHRLVSGRDLILGGEKIPHSQGLDGHSDADVLVHAIMDAILGAMALGDIGRHFPDSSDEFKGISSIILLERVRDIMKSNGYSFINLDSTLIMQAPKVAPFIEEMRQNISRALKVDVSLVNVKATTEEHLGFTGRREGVSSHAVVLLQKE